MKTKIYFKPMPGLTIVLVISVAILIALGAWQYQRLEWKTAILADVEAAITAPPFTSLAEVERAIANEEPVDFRRIEIEAELQKGTTYYHLYSPQPGGIYWNVLTPITSQGLTIYADMREIETVEKSQTASIVKRDDVQKITGYVRNVYPMGLVESWVKSKANSESNRYFYFNQTGDWYDDLPAARLEDIYIDVVPANTARDLPVLRPDIPNNHFDYMLTWWSFALIFIVIYVILHRRAGRLSFS